MIVREVIIDNDDERFASLQNLNTSPSSSVGYDQVSTGNVGLETWFVLVGVSGQDSVLGVIPAQVTLATLNCQRRVAKLGQTLLHLGRENCSH